MAQSHEDDPFYRYRIPKVDVKMEGSKTIIVNMVELSKTLNRPPNCKCSSDFNYLKTLFLF